MATFKNSSFLYSDTNYKSRHKGRGTRQQRKMFLAYKDRNKLKLQLLYGWNISLVHAWAEAAYTLSNRRFTKNKTSKPGCAYSNRVRSVNSYLKLSKYQIAKFSRMGIIKDLKKF